MERYRLRSYEFRREREPVWRALEHLVSVVEEGGVADLPPDALLRLPELHRATLSSLSVAKAISLDRNIIEYLEDLARRSHLCVYSPHLRLRGAVFSFFARRYPRAVWGMRRNLLIAGLLMLAGTAGGLALTAEEPGRFYNLVDAEYAGGRSPLSTREELREVLTGTGAIGTLANFASFLLTHNAKVGLLCYPLGIPAGVPVILLVFINGLTLGALVAIHVPHGLTIEFLGWLLPHGVTEVLAICICAAAGLTLGESLVFPGRFSRIENLTQKGREGGAVVLGTVALFLLAAIVEGFFRQLVHSTAIRMTFAAASGAFWLWYFGIHAPRVAR